jgi:hypothetical protein
MVKRYFSLKKDDIYEEMFEAVRSDSCLAMIFDGW